MARSFSSKTKQSLDATKMRGRSIFLLTTAAALSTSLPTTANAFASRPPTAVPAFGYGALSVFPSWGTHAVTTTTRLYSSNEDEGMLKKMAKSVLPKKWFQSEEEQKVELARQQVKDNVSGSIKELLKDAPLPVRMVGSMVAPLLSRAASELSEGMAEQQQQVETVIRDAKALILGDDVACQAIGEPIQVGAPFSQSSSTSIINGQKSVNIALAFPVEGSRSSGVAQAQANQNGITQLVLQVDGRQINVSLSKRGTSSGRVGKNHQTGGSKYDDGDIIEAEIIEKDPQI